MAESFDFYPAAPPDVPPNLTKPTGSYRLRVLVVLTSLCLFVLLYVGLVVGSAYACWWCFASLGSNQPMNTSRPSYDYRPPPQPRQDTTYLQVIGGILSGALCLFLVKGLFKRQRPDNSVRLEITLEQQPILFSFIHMVCRDTRSPRPHRVYLSADVNAAVFYHQSFLNLFLPARKNLLVGLGLMNRLNLTEFKAVLAHEFGHFSQNSMKLGAYVYRSNHIICDLVYGRDWLDNLVAMLRGIDIRIAIFAWAFTGIMWVMRKTLQGVFRVINFANSSLSRQMEFNADLVAVSVTGSDALINGLARLDFATESLNHAWNDLVGAADRKMYTSDLFYHQTSAAEYLRSVRNEPRLGEPPPLSQDPDEIVQVFQPEDISVPRMWATHPCNYDRETNAKKHYIRNNIDERSPWMLIQAVDAVKEAVTRQLYQSARLLPGAPGQTADAEEDAGVPVAGGGSRHRQPPKLQPPEVVQAFIDEEHAETTYNPRYHGVFDNRYVKPGDINDLIRTNPDYGNDRGRLAKAHSDLFGEEIKTKMAAHKSRQQELNLLAGVANGAVALARKDFAFRGERFRAGDAGRLLKKVQKELDKDYEWMNVLDREVFLVYHVTARQVSNELRWDLESRYRFHLEVQDIHGILTAHNQQIQQALAAMAGGGTMQQQDFQWVLGVFQKAHDSVRQSIERAGRLSLPALKNVTPGTALGPMLLAHPLVRGVSTSQKSLDGEWIVKFLEQLGEVVDKVRRIHFKSLGGILGLQEKIAEQWQGGRQV